MYIIINFVQSIFYILAAVLLIFRLKLTISLIVRSGVDWKFSFSELDNLTKAEEVNFPSGLNVHLEQQNKKQKNNKKNKKNKTRLSWFHQYFVSIAIYIGIEAVW